ncbi:MAG: hypothetical protein AAF530_21665 [Pseudomonadota bacterium]
MIQIIKNIVFFSIFCGLLSGCATPPPPQPVYAEPFCYRTLAEADCHEVPLAGQDDRIVSEYQPPIGYKIEEPEKGQGILGLY